MQNFRFFWFLLIFFRGISLFSQDGTYIIYKDSEDLSSKQKGYNQILTEALNLQLKADSLSRIARDKKIMAREIPDAVKKKELSDEILIAEQEAERYQVEADQLFARAREIKKVEIRQVEQHDAEVSLSGIINGIKVYQYKTDMDVESATTIRNSENIETYWTLQSNGPDNDLIRSEGNSDDFKILEQSPYNEGNPFPEGMDMITGLTYRIQLGVFSSPVPFDAFAGVSPVYFEKAGDGSLLKYYAGLFYSLANVTLALERVRMIGFPDAFVVAFLDGDFISTEKAREIEYAQFKL